MNKKITLRAALLPLIVLAILLVTTSNVYAGEVSAVNVSSDDGSVTVSGTVGNGVVACVVCVYDETGNTLIAMESCTVKSDNSYSYTLHSTLEEGKYLIKVADYNGGTAVSKNVAVVSATTVTATTVAEITSETATTTAVATTTQTAASPATSDTCNLFLILVMMTVAGGAVVVLSMRRNER